MTSHGHNSDESAVEQSLRALAALRDLDGGSWRLRAISDSDGEPLIWGTRIWPDNCVDTFVFRNIVDTQAFRTREDGALLWRSNGSLDEIVAALVQLPQPDATDAPCDAIGPNIPSNWSL